jgi:hypothetical protein
MKVEQRMQVTKEMHFKKDQIDLDIREKQMQGIKFGLKLLNS